MPLIKEDIIGRQEKSTSLYSNSQRTKRNSATCRHTSHEAIFLTTM